MMIYDKVDEMKDSKRIFIGTLHSGSTPHDELIDILRKYNLDKLFVELTPEEITKERRSLSIRDEMLAAYDWAQENAVNVFRLTSKTKLLKKE